MWHHTTIFYLVRVKLKLETGKSVKKERPLDLNKLKSQDTISKFQIELTNRFEALQQTEDIHETEEIFTNTAMDCANNVIGKKRGSKKEQWITEHTWNLIHDGKEAKKKRDSAKTEQKKSDHCQNYQKLDKMVKRSFKKDKNNWLEGRIGEAQEAAQRNDPRALYTALLKKLLGQNQILVYQ